MLRSCLLASLIGLACAQSNTQSNNWYSASAGSSTVSTASSTASIMSSSPSSTPTTRSSTSAIATSSSISPSTRSSTAAVSTSSSPSSSATSSSVASPSITSSRAASSSTFAGLRAVATLAGTASVTGTVTIQQADATSPASIIYSITGNDPSMMRGIHIHSGSDTVCANAGPHFNPMNVSHGGLADAVRHAGDLGNIATDSSGKAEGTVISNLVSLFGPVTPSTLSVVGRTFIIHGGMDDNGKGTGDAMMLSQTTGNSGGRVACGIIMLTT